MLNSFKPSNREAVLLRTVVLLFVALVVLFFKVPESDVQKNVPQHHGLRLGYPGAGLRAGAARRHAEFDTRAGASAMERCSSKQKHDYNIMMKDIHSTNPYLDFSPQKYGVKGLDLRGWGLDLTHKYIFDYIKPKFMVEVGSWKGLSAVNFASMMRSTHGNNSCLMLICVDTWLGTTKAWESPDMENPTHENTLHLRNGYPSVYYQFLYNVIDKGYHDIIVPLPLPGVMGAIFLQRKGARPDTIFIDGCHDELCVYQDIESWFPVLKEDGILFGDDFGRGGVKKAVFRFCDQTRNCMFHKELSSSRTWVIRKNQKDPTSGAKQSEDYRSPKQRHKPHP